MASNCPAELARNSRLRDLESAGGRGEEVGKEGGEGGHKEGGAWWRRERGWAVGGRVWVRERVWVSMGREQVRVGVSPLSPTPPDGTWANPSLHFHYRCQPKGSLWKSPN